MKKNKADMLLNLEWFSKGKCSNQTDLMFDIRKEYEAREICANCGVRETCAKFAIKELFHNPYPDGTNPEIYAVIAGMTPEIFVGVYRKTYGGVIMPMCISKNCTNRLSIIDVIDNKSYCKACRTV